MTVNDRDLSNYGGAPITLYEFTRRSTPTISGVEIVTRWRYTSADRDVVIGSDTFTALPMEDDGLRQSGDTSNDTVTIAMPATAAIPTMFVGSPPSDPISVLIMRTHNGEPDTLTAWAGLIGLVTRSDEITSKVLCNTLSGTFDRRGLRLVWQRGCPHDLYGNECRANPLLFYRTGPAITVAGNIVTVADFATVPDNRFTGGWIEWLDSYGHAERRAIIEHGGQSVRVLGLADGLAVGATSWAFFGCPHNRDGCTTIFNNLPNYGGHAYMVDKSPFSGDAIF